MSDFSIYPEGIDGYAQLPLAVDKVTPVDAVSVNRLRSAIVNIETELGTSPSGDSTTLKARLDGIDDALASVDTTVADRVTDLETADEQLGYKNPARVATTTNIANLSYGAPNSVDGVTVVAGDRILVANQTDQSENGIYSVTTAGSGSNGVWARSPDANTSDKLVPGTEIYITEGDTYGTCKFWLVTTGTITLEATSLNFISGVKIMQSDATPTTVYSNTTMPTSETGVTAIDVRNFREIEWFITVDAKLTATQFDIKIQYSDLENPTSGDWSYMQAQDLFYGTATLTDYVAKKSLIDIASSTVFRIPISSKVKGRTMRITISSDAATDTVEVAAIRRV